MSKTRIRGKLKRFLLTYAPDFCWMTAYDLLLMTEQEMPDIDENSFKVTLSRLTREGHFRMRKTDLNQHQLKLTSSIHRIDGRSTPPMIYIRTP